MRSKTQNKESLRNHLLRRAAAIGPGYRGERQSTNEFERGQLLHAFEELGENPPGYLQNSDMEWVEKQAKLFEAGDYPDKGVTITPKDLKILEKNFDLPVPVLIEHATSPLEIGYLTTVSTQGNELFGQVALTREAHALIERSGAKSLSIGLSPDLQTIRELSLVRNPRVTDARLFSAGVLLAEEFSNQKVEEPTTAQGTSEIHEEINQEFLWRTKYEALSQQLLEKSAEERIANYLKEGKLTPAQVPFAKALLCLAENVEFDGESIPIVQLIKSLLERQPAHVLFTEQAPEQSPEQSQEENLLAPEEAAFYQRYFPNIHLSEIAQRKKR